MPTELPPFDPKKSSWPRHQRSGEVDWTSVTLCVPAVILALAAVLPAPLVLPGLSIVAVLASTAMAVAGKLRFSARMATARARDIAGILMLIGLGASMMTDPGEALRSIAEIEAAYQSTTVAIR